MHLHLSRELFRIITNKLFIGNQALEFRTALCTSPCPGGFQTPRRRQPISNIHARCHSGRSQQGKAKPKTWEVRLGQAAEKLFVKQ
jgi:hypothetical protein